MIEGCEGNGSRAIKDLILTNIFRACIVKYPDDLPNLFYFFIMRLGPEWENQEFGMTHDFICKTMGKACGKELKDVRSLCKSEGDIGNAALKIKTEMGKIGNFFTKEQ